VPLCHWFLCGSMHTNGMPEWQNLTLLLQNVLGSQCFPNWPRLHATPYSFTQGARSPCQSELLPLPLRASENRGSETCIKLFNLCKYHFPGGPIGGRRQCQYSEPKHTGIVRSLVPLCHLLPIPATLGAITVKTLVALSKWLLTAPARKISGIITK
jgi:hypothetical protein